MSTSTKFEVDHLTPTEDVIINWEQRVGGLTTHEMNVMRHLVVSKEGAGATVAGAFKCVPKSQMVQIFATLKLPMGYDWMLRYVGKKKK